MIDFCLPKFLVSQFHSRYNITTIGYRAIIVSGKAVVLIHYLRLSSRTACIFTNFTVGSRLTSTWDLLDCFKADDIRMEPHRMSWERRHRTVYYLAAWTDFIGCSVSAVGTLRDTVQTNYISPNNLVLNQCHRQSTARKSYPIATCDQK